MLEVLRLRRCDLPTLHTTLAEAGIFTEVEPAQLIRIGIESANEMPTGKEPSSSALYIQSEARQGVTVHLGPAEFVHLKEIRGTPEASGSSLLGPTTILISVLPDNVETLYAQRLEVIVQTGRRSMIVLRVCSIAALILVACGPSTAPSASATASQSSPLIVVAETDSSGVTHNLKLYALDGRLTTTFRVTADVWPLAAAGKRIFVQKSNRLEAIDRTGSIEDLGPLTVGANEIAFIIPSPDGTHWLQAITPNIHEAGDGMSDRVVATGTGSSPLQVYAWTSTTALIYHSPGFPFRVSTLGAFPPRWPIASVDTLDVGSGVSTPVAGSAGCQPGDVSAQGVYVCFVQPRNDAIDATQTLRLMPSTGQPIDIRLPLPLFSEAGAAWFSPSGKVLTLAAWDGNGHFGQPGQPLSGPPVEIHTYLVDLTGKITPFGPAGAQPALDAQTWLPGGKILLERRVGAAGGDPGLFLLDANGHGPFIRDSSRPIGVIS